MCCARAAVRNPPIREKRAEASSRALRRVREKIENSLANGATLNDLASEIGLSRAHFARAFKTSTGVPRTSS